jgi:hypothetical protein
MQNNVISHKKEKYADSARPCLDELPYRTIVYMRSNGTNSLYSVAGVEGGPWGATNALKRAFHKHGGPCFYCSETIRKDDFTIDHVESKCSGGKSHLQNLVISHKTCNAKKGSQLIEVYDPKAGREWLVAVHRQIEDRLNRLTSLSATTPTAPAASTD